MLNMKTRAVLAIVALAILPSVAMAQTQTPCGVPAIPSMAVPTGLSRLTPQGGPVIIFNPVFFQQTPQLFTWMLYHECAHHMNGDIVGEMMNPQGYMMVNPQVELRADCTSARAIRASGDPAALQSLQFAIAYWQQMGPAPTGPNYPSGIQRAQTLVQCSGP
jgi:hypothetical protein